jgi:hypothetical protein
LQIKGCCGVSAARANHPFDCYFSSGPHCCSLESSTADGVEGLRRGARARRVLAVRTSRMATHF